MTLRQNLLILFLLCFVVNIAFSLDISSGSEFEEDVNDYDTTTTTKPSPTSSSKPTMQQCGIQTVQPRLRNVRKIITGRKAVSYSFPWQVFLDGEFICGGTIIDADTVITAAHCILFDNLTMHEVEVVAGVNDIDDEDNNEVRKRVRVAAYHSEYTATLLFHDIAVLKLQNALDFSGRRIKPICLPAPGEEPAHDEYCVVSGWGSQRDPGSVDYEDYWYSSKLLQAEVRIVNDSECLIAMGEDADDLDPETNICAGGNGRDTCQGDSGGPLQCKRADGTWYLAGVTAWGFECGGPLPGIYTQVEHYLSWISLKRKL